MANEIRGLLFETIADAALQKAIGIAGIPGQVFWNEKPKGMSIVPDFTIGKDKDHPTHLLLVTATGAARNADMKSWRNLGEMQEVKTQLLEIPSVVNLVFKSEIKQGLIVVSEALYDSVLHVDRQKYYEPLEKWVQENVANDANTREARQAVLEQDAKADSKLAKAIDDLATDLSEALQQNNKELNSLWKIMREDYLKPHNPPEAKQTYIRRGIGKLSILEPNLRQFVYEASNKKKGIEAEKVPGYAVKYFKRSMIGMVLADAEMVAALRLLGTDACEAVLQRAPKSMDIWITPLRNLDRVATHVEFIESHYNEITSPDGLQNLLIQCFQDPSGLSGEQSDEKVWIYEIMISLLKAKSGLLQGYGLAQLAQDAKMPEVGAGGFLIPPFVQRGKMLSDRHLEGLAQGLADRFSQNVPKSSLTDLKAKVVDWVIKENLEDRLLPYRNFEPLLWLLETELKKQNKPYEAKTPYAGWINEYAAVGKKSATTPFVRVGETLIHWKSAHAGHPNDKTKELSARARSIRYQYDPTRKTFTRRKDVSQLALIVDGDWKEQHLQTLSTSGWDIIVYPDQIPDLVQQL
jgi:hypothetical protein